MLRKYRKEEIFWNTVEIIFAKKVKADKFGKACYHSV